VQSYFPDGHDPKGFAHFDLWYTTIRGISSHPDIVANQQLGAYVRPSYFVEQQTDHLVWIFGWTSARPAVVEVGGQSLLVPHLVEALVGTDSGYWVALEIQCMGVFIPGEPIAVTQVNVMADASPERALETPGQSGRDVSRFPSFPIRRWAEEALRDTNRLLADGAIPAAEIQPTTFPKRSNAPSIERLMRVVELREGDPSLSYRVIGERLGTSEATACRDYKRAKAQGL